ncbi:MAG TPA: hypothetical protein VGM67_00710 [Gemmatimonadaceae bacterium]|jgi:hypothetical protein
MPITAKPSRKVHERLGDDVVNAIVDWFNQVDATYRADLREMNDLNFARFDAKMGERFAEFDVKIERRFAEVEKRFAELEVKFERRFAEFGRKFEQRFGELEVRLSRRIFATSTASFLAQLVALVTLFKIFAPR